MAAKPKSNVVPKTAAVKEAEAALYQASVQGLEAAKVRTAQQSRGAVRQRRLRSGGTDLYGYLIGGYKDDAMPAPPPAPRAPSGGGTRSGGTTRTTKPKSKPKAPKPTTHKQAVKKQTKMSDARGDSLSDARKRAKAKLQEKKRAASKAGQSQQRSYRSRPVTPRAPGYKPAPPKRD